MGGALLLSLKPTSCTRRLGSHHDGMLFYSKLLSSHEVKSPTSAVIKTAPPGLRTSLDTEIKMYSKPCVQNCQHIQPMLDIITEHDHSTCNPPLYLALACMDNNISYINLKQYADDPIIPTSILTQILQNLIPFEVTEKVHSAKTKHLERADHF